jgi:hypothetical protein
MSHVERRRHVRLKPTAELPARATLDVSGLLKEALDVVDISAGGVALVKPPNGVTSGARIELRLALGADGEHAFGGVVRWVSADAFGIEFVEPAPPAEQALRRYVGELLERGMSV